MGSGGFAHIWVPIVEALDKFVLRELSPPCIFFRIEELNPMLHTFCLHLLNPGQNILISALPQTAFIDSSSLQGFDELLHSAFLWPVRMKCYTYLE